MYARTDTHIKCVHAKDKRSLISTLYVHHHIYNVFFIIQKTLYALYIPEYI